MGPSAGLLLLGLGALALASASARAAQPTRAPYVGPIVRAPGALGTVVEPMRALSTVPGLGPGLPSTASRAADAYNGSLRREKRRTGGTYLRAAPEYVCDGDRWPGAYMALAERPRAQVALPPELYAVSRRMGPTPSLDSGRGDPSELRRRYPVPDTWQDPRRVLCDAGAAASRLLGRDVSTFELVQRWRASIPVRELRPTDAELLGLLPYQAAEAWGQDFASAYRGAIDPEALQRRVAVASVAQVDDWRWAFGYDDLRYREWEAEQRRRESCLKDLDGNPETCGGVAEGVWFFMTLVVQPAAVIVSALV